MPTYTYACSQCDQRFDAVQSIHDAALTECTECTGPVRRVISAVGVSFKGSGFYRTDSRATASTTSSSTTTETKAPASAPAAGSSSAAASPA